MVCYIAVCNSNKTSLHTIVKTRGEGGGGGTPGNSKVLQIPFEFAYFFFFPSAFGIETINKSIHSSSSLESHNRFEIEMGKVYTRFQTKVAQKPYPIGRHIPIWLIWMSNPPPPSPNGGVKTIKQIIKLTSEAVFFFETLSGHVLLRFER